MDDSKKINLTLYTIPELCEILEISRPTCFSYLRSGVLKGQKIGGKWKVSRDSLQEYLQQIEIPPTAEQECNTGKFNDIIKGYLIVTLRDMGKSDKEITKALKTLEQVFEDTPGELARAAYNNFYFC